MILICRNVQGDMFMLNPNFGGVARNDDGISRRSRKLNINTKEQGADPDWLPAAVSPH